MANTFQDGLAAAHAGDYAAADRIAADLLAADKNDVHAYQIIGFSNFCRGRNHEALQAFTKANALAPNQPTILNWIGILLREAGEFAQALRAFQQAAQLSPNSAEFLCNLAGAYALSGDREKAREAFERAAGMESADPGVLARTARFYEQTHELALAREMAERALADDPENETALIALGEIDMRERKYEDIVARLGAFFPSDAVNARNQSKLWRLYADALDRTGCFEDAFTAYTRSNELQRDLYTDFVARERSPLTKESLERYRRFYQSEDVSAWTEHHDFPDPTPAFLVGFSRSGTTWLDQILSSHPRIEVMEEEDNFVEAWTRFALSDEGLAKLGALSRAEVAHYRRAYWRRAIQHLDGETEGRLIIDKVPLHTMQLGLIHRFFPHAKIIFAIRDPRDSILSCFQQHFAMNAAMFRFLDFGAAAEFYDDVMSLGRLYREKFPLNVHEVRYEDLVADLESEVRPILNFLEVEWTPSVLEYDKTAKARTILTPSATQVIHRPYATSIAKWRNYREPMTPALPILNKWAAHFGYDLE